MSWKKIRVVEVGARDGLQNESRIRNLPEDDLVRIRTDFILALAKSGLKDVEAGAFVRAEEIPQMIATDRVLKNLQDEAPKIWESHRFWTLVPNMRGLEDAVHAGAKHISVFTAATDEFNKQNINMTIDQSLREIESVMIEAKSNNMAVRGYVSCVWGCPYAVESDPKQSLAITEQLLELGAVEVSLGDTVGVATPNRVHKVLELFDKEWPLAVHFHDTRGTAIANSLRAIDEGISVIDSSAGGLGGCPYAPGASGNLATEDLLYMLHGMMLDSGVDIKQVCEASEKISEELGLTLPSRYHATWRADQKRDKK